MRKILLMALAPLLLTACATAPQYVDLKPVEKAADLISASNMCSTIDHGYLDFCLLAGSYRVWKENSVGRFVLGEGKPLYFSDRKEKKNYVIPGGLWLPKDNSASLAIFIIAGASPEYVDSIEEAISLRGTAGDTKSDPLLDLASAPTIKAPQVRQPVAAPVLGAATGLAYGIVGLMIGDEPQPMFMDTVGNPTFKKTVDELLKKNPDVLDGGG